jgi:hypothetical protein
MTGLAFQTARRAGSLTDILVVPGAGIEPARPLSRKILSLVCLPISPSGRDENLAEPMPLKGGGIIAYYCRKEARVCAAVIHLTSNNL